MVNPEDMYGMQNQMDSTELNQSKNGSIRNRKVEPPLDSLDEALNSV